MKTEKNNLMSTYRKSIAATLAAAVLASNILLPSNADAESNQSITFSDLESTHWAYSAIESIVQKQLVSGYEDGTYKPDGQVTRAEFATFLSRIFEGDERGESSFKDIADEHWAKDAIEEGLALGYINEADFKDGKFDPNKAMTRIEIAKWFANGLLKVNSDYVQVLEDLSQQNARLPFNEFTNGSLQRENVPYVGLMLGTGLMQGYNGSFNPNNNTSRAEVAVMMVRYMDAIEKGPESYAKLTELREIANNPRPSFTDLSESHWAYDSVQQAIDKGYVSGYPDGTFRPDQVVAHSEFMKMLVVSFGHEVGASPGQWYEPYVNVAKEKGYITAEDAAATTWTGQMTRNDVAKRAMQGVGVKNYYGDRKWLYLATSAGIILGTDNKGTLDENKTLTRAQAITIIERIHQVKAGETLPTDKRAISQAEVYYHRTNMFTMFSHVLDARQVDKIQNNDVFKRSYYNGAYSDETLGIYIIDLADANDPYRHLLNGGVYGPNSESVLNLNSGYVVIHKGRMLATSNPANLEMYTTGGTALYIGNTSGSMGVRWKGVSNSINLKLELNTTKELIGGTYYPLETIQKPESIGIYKAEAWQFGGQTSTQHYLQYTK